MIPNQPTYPGSFLETEHPKTLPLENDHKKNFYRKMNSKVADGLPVHQLFHLKATIMAGGE